MNRTALVIMLLAFYLFIDFYGYQVFKSAFSHGNALFWKVLKVAYWLTSAIFLGGMLFFSLGGYAYASPLVRAFVQGSVFVVLLPKLFLSVFALLDDVIRLGRWAYSFIEKPNSSDSSEGRDIGRLQFIGQTAVVAASIPVVGASWGILSGAHDYKIRRRTLNLSSLPKAFDGLRIVQLSDIHSGSFWNKKAVIGGVEMAMAEKPDVIFFTGDLVNDQAKEMKDWANIFAKLKAPMGTYSVLGNHDYGDYVNWPSAAAKRQNLQDLMDIQKQMGWRLLMDENVRLKVDGDEIAIVGIQNWGAKGRFPKYGDLSKAKMGTEDVETKLLLSHDPSHWRAQVLQDHKDIDVMFAGHTHGAQFGIETANYKWSPVSLMYDEWADLYKENGQQLYVNRGFGYIGYPGRLGILPEITVFELKSA